MLDVILRVKLDGVLCLCIAQYELLEMIRKLLMVGGMGIIMPGLPQQFAAGLIITICFMALSLRLQPWAHPGLNALNFFSLSFQAIVLFTGLVKSIAAFTKESTRKSDNAASEVMVMVLTLMVAIVPACILFVENGLDPFAPLKAQLRYLCRCCSKPVDQTRRSGDLSAADMSPHLQTAINPEIRKKGAVKLFVDIDANHSGDVSRDEMKAALQKHNPEITDNQVDRLFAQLDTNYDNMVSKQEFLAPLVFRCRTCNAHMNPRSMKCEMCGDARGHVSHPPSLAPAYSPSLAPAYSPFSCPSPLIRSLSFCVSHSYCWNLLHRMVRSLNKGWRRPCCNTMAPQEKRTQQAERYWPAEQRAWTKVSHRLTGASLRQITSAPRTRARSLIKIVLRTLALSTRTLLAGTSATDSLPLPQTSQDVFWETPMRPQCARPNLITP